jgi:hypothetical protein
MLRIAPISTGVARIDQMTNPGGGPAQSDESGVESAPMNNTRLTEILTADFANELYANGGSHVDAHQ